MRFQLPKRNEIDYMEFLGKFEGEEEQCVCSVYRTNFGTILKTGSNRGSSKCENCRRRSCKKAALHACAHSTKSQYATGLS